MSDHYHPWVEAQHVTGLGFPATGARHERFREAREIIRLLWRGGYRSYDGKHLKLEDARVFDLPAELPVMFADAGFDHLVAMNRGPDPDGFMDLFASELAAPLRALTPVAA
jgi:hypothetical protein